MKQEEILKKLKEIYDNIEYDTQPGTIGSEIINLIIDIRKDE